MVWIYGIHCAVRYLASNTTWGGILVSKLLRPLASSAKVVQRKTKQMTSSCFTKEAPPCRTFTRCETDRLDCQAQVVWENHPGQGETRFETRDGQWDCWKIRIEKVHVDKCSAVNQITRRPFQFLWVTHVLSLLRCFGPAWCY